ncbi:MAG: 50S ribosomal protein L21e [Candidatus Aenigmatarchaeota archaeon]
MVRKSYGFRRRTRNKLKQNDIMKPNMFLQRFDIGNRVHIDIQSSSQKIPHPKFQGRTGVVIGKRGNAYIVEVKDLNTKKQIIVNPEHLKRC